MKCRVVCAHRCISLFLLYALLCPAFVTEAFGAEWAAAQQGDSTEHRKHPRSTIGMFQRSNISAFDVERGSISSPVAGDRTTWRCFFLQSMAQSARQYALDRTSQGSLVLGLSGVTVFEPWEAQMWRSQELYGACLNPMNVNRVTFSLPFHDLILPCIRVFDNKK